MRDRNADGGIGARVAVVEAVPDRLARRERAGELAVVADQGDRIGRVGGHWTGRGRDLWRRRIGGRGRRRGRQRGGRRQCTDEADETI